MPEEYASDQPAPSRGRPMEVAVLFADLVSSSEFSSILSLEAYSDYVAAFEDVCRRQCEYFFEVYQQGHFQKGVHYRLELLGDELAVFLYSGNGPNDVYQLICLAVSLKCCWLTCDVNIARIKQSAPTVEMAIGIHAGAIWATPDPHLGYILRGFVINVAKRVETASRDGEHFRIVISGAAFKRVNPKIRHLLFGPKKLVPMKGIVVPVAVHELVDSFVDPSQRMDPAFLKVFRDVALGAIASNSFDMWVHSCFQVIEGARNGCVCDQCVDLCREVLRINPGNGVAMYYAAEALIERDQLSAAILLLSDLTRCWPTFTDGWLELARTAKKTGDLSLARHCVLQARRYGAAEDEEALPELPPLT